MQTKSLLRDNDTQMRMPKCTWHACKLWPAVFTSSSTRLVWMELYINEILSFCLYFCFYYTLQWRMSSDHKEAGHVHVADEKPGVTKDHSSGKRTSSPESSPPHARKFPFKIPSPIPTRRTRTTSQWVNVTNLYSRCKIRGEIYGYHTNYVSLSIVFTIVIFPAVRVWRDQIENSTFIPCQGVVNWFPHSFYDLWFSNLTVRISSYKIISWNVLYMYCTTLMCMWLPCTI